MSVPSIVADLGAATVRAVALSAPQNTVEQPNICASLKNQLEVLVGDQVETEVSDTSALTYISPFERGVITDWDSQGAVLHRVVSQLGSPLPGCHLTCTLPALTPARQQEMAWEAVFEAHSVASAAFLPPPLAAALCAEGVALPPTLPSAAAPSRVQGGFTGLIVDAGHSAITATPVILGVPHTGATKRSNIGGKAVGNALASSVSKRQVDLLSTPLAVRRMLQRLALVHPTGGARLLQDASAADVCGAAGASSAVRSAYLRHVAPHRKGVCTQLEAVTWASASVRALVASAHGGAAAAATTASSASTEPASPKRARRDSQDAQGSAPRTDTAYTSNNRLLNCVPQGQLGMGWLGGLKGGSEEHTLFDTLARQTALGDAVLQGDMWGDTQWGHGSTREPHPLLDDGCGLGVVREWVLPDGVAVAGGFVRGGAGDPFMPHRLQQLCSEWPGVQPSAATAAEGVEGGVEVEAEAPPTDEGLASVTLASERFLPCEMLFRPDGAGVLQGGAAAAVAAAVAAAPAEWQPALWGNIAVVGGVACLPGMVARLRREVRALAPADSHVAVWRVPCSQTATLRGLSWLSAQPLRARVAVSRESYEEAGAARVAEAAAQVWLANGAPHLCATARMSVDGGVSAAPALLAAAAGGGGE